MRVHQTGLRRWAVALLALAGTGLAGAAGAQVGTQMGPQAGPQAGAPAAGNVAEGRRLAERYCRTCHVLTERNQAGWTDAPAFPVIAARGGMSAARIEALLQTSPLHMLNMPRSPTEAADLAAFVMSLRR